MLLVIGVILFIVSYEIYQLNYLSVSKYIISTNKIKKNSKIKIVQISDLHSKKFGKDNKRLIEKIIALKPDVIFMTGDILDRNDKNFDVVYFFISKIIKKYPIYYIKGNHEISIKYEIYREYERNLKNLGVKILKDEKEKININGNDINVYGLSYKCNIINLKEKYLKYIENKAGKINDRNYNIILMHDPSNAELIDKLKCDLILSGHIHGGIIRIGKFGILSPLMKFIPKYSAGLYNLENSKLIVSRGLGKSRAKVRVNNLPDIVEITIN